MFMQALRGRHVNVDAQVSASIDAYYQIPKSTPKARREGMISGLIRPTKKPDIDNVAKAICDSINGVAYRDDSQIVCIIAEKRYAETPRVRVTIVWGE
jgi:Holliday junction resolvase RusA-like endonuclease